MTEDKSSTVHASVPDDVQQSLLNDSIELQKKGHLEQNVLIESTPDQFIKTKDNNQFIGLTKEELKSYINNPKWKRIRWIVALVYLGILLSLLVGSILLVVFSSRCPPKPKLSWYKKNIIYEVDLTRFKDSNNDGIGDLKGLEDQLKYLETNNIKSILFSSSIFDHSNSQSIELNQQLNSNKKIDLLTIDPSVANEQQLDQFVKNLNRKDFNLIIDLPLGSTFDPNGLSWYGSDQPLRSKITNPCSKDSSSIACRFSQSYGYLPLNFNNQLILNQSLHRINYWLLNKKFDGIRVNLPLALKNATKTLGISYKTIDQWIKTVEDIQKKTKPKLLLFDVPFGLENLIDSNKLNQRATYSILNNQQTKVYAKDLDQRLNSFNENIPKPKFWKLGSQRKSDDIGILNEKQIEKEILLTLTMLVGGTPVILYGEEINLNRRENPLMSWRPDRSFQGFSNCSSDQCSQNIQMYQNSLPKTSVLRQEAVGGSEKDSLLKVFRYLSKLRQKESFQHGLLEYGFDEKTNLFWFIREASGHPGYVVLLNLNEKESEKSHISLYELTLGDVPTHIHCEYQWPIQRIPISNTTHINSDNLLIDPQSINIFSWPTKTIKPKVLEKKFEEHSNEHHQQQQRI